MRGRSSTISTALMLLFVCCLMTDVIEFAEYKQNLFPTHGRSSCTDNSSLGDCDNDSINNSNEDINNDGNWSNDDTDGDGVPNYLDDDDDDDGWPTWMECPLSPGQNHDDCPGFGNVKDYLHENLYNCEQPFLQLS